VFGHAPGGYAPLSEFVGESPLPEAEFVHCLSTARCGFRPILSDSVIKYEDAAG
jgi:hypothetical protein